MKPRTLAAAALLLAAASPAAAQVDPAPRVDALFSRFSGADTPGCAVAVARDGVPVLSRAYGMADLEHDVPITPETVFEAGSVSKQFTAAAVILLAREGKLSLDDDVREYIPELPDYGEPITIRHLVNHTSGLRDWGSVAAISGWPRGSRVHTNRHALDIMSRQRGLNYPPGEYFSYTNSGYNLQAILVERVSGMPFAEFTRRRIFEPLGMTSTEWRDDFTRVVEDRAVAYRPAPGGGFRLDMPFEDVHGNGGLLTTVADLLRWTEALQTGRGLDPALVEEMHRQARLDGGRVIEYAGGLFVTDHLGVPEVSHGGATGGYRAYLARFPEQHVAVALLCNAAHASSGGLAHDVARLYLDGYTSAPAEPAAADVAPAALAARAGVYRDTRTGQPIRIDFEEGRLRISGGPELVPLSASSFRAGSAGRAEFQGDGRSVLLRVAPDGDTLRYEPVDAFHPSAAELARYAGSYHSDEAEATFRVEVRDGRLAVVDRYGDAVPVEPAYADAFVGRGGLYRFLRGPSGEVEALSVGSSRVWDLRFSRRP